MLLWRVATNFLPTKDNLCRFLDEGELIYPLCNSETESIVHLFALCPVAKAIWFNSQWGLRTEFLSIASTSDFIQFLFAPPFIDNSNRSQREELLLIGAILCDLIWRLRNQVQFEGLKVRQEDLVPRIMKAVAKHKNSRVPLDSLASLVVSGPQNWVPPNCLSIKINVDGVVGPHYSSMAVVVRNWRGELVFACSQKLNTTFPLLVEANAIKWILLLMMRKITKLRISSRWTDDPAVCRVYGPSLQENSKKKCNTSV